jgi:hypothetical protein
MPALIAFIGRVLAVLPLIVSSGISLIQIAIKCVKEIVTACINLLFPLFPDGGKFEKFVLAVRDKINAFEDWFGAIKDTILKLTGAKA